MKPTETKTAESLMEELQLEYFKADVPQKRGAIARRINKLYVQVMFLEECLLLESLKHHNLENV